MAACYRPGATLAEAFARLLSSLLPDLVVELSAEDASVRGIETGDVVRVSSNGTSVELRARVNRRLVAGAAQVSAEDLSRKLHETIDKVTRDVEAFRFNTAMSALMELANLMQDYLQAGGRRDEAWEAVCLGMTRMLGPFAPHLAEELWQRQGGDGLLVFQPWPAVDEALLRRPQVTIVVQIDGRLRDRIEMPAGIDQAAAKERALRSQNVQRAVGDRRVLRAVYVPDRLINLVTQ